MGKKLWTAVFLLGLGAALLGGGYWYETQYNNNQALASDQKVRFTVKKGMGTKEIAALLHEKDVVAIPETFRIAVKLRGLDNSLQAGNYEVKPGISNQELITMLAEGKVRYNTFTVPEGASIPEIGVYLEKKHLGNAIAFQEAARRYAPFPYMQTSNPDVIYTAEGFVYPSTYHLPEGATEQQILEIMVKEFDKRLTPELRADIAKTNMSIRDVVNVAAMVEREATQKEEMPIMASIFLRRMKMGMPIQSDTTVQYILGAHHEVVTYDDLKVESPYNTYLHKGLPPGPIANPSIEAIEAVTHPIQTEYLYFVADKNGYHRFTKTYEEHQAMIQRINGDSDEAASGNGDTEQ